MREYKSASLADQVFEKLENDIIHGAFAHGEILTELKLVEQLGVSRTPIREALRRLEQERLIEDTGKGSRVVGINEEDVLDIMNIRLHLEGLAAYYATKNMTYEHMALYIRQQENATTLMIEFKKQIEMSKVQTNPYRSVLAWFKQQFEHYDDYKDYFDKLAKKKAEKKDIFFVIESDVSFEEEDTEDEE